MYPSAIFPKWGFHKPSRFAIGTQVDFGSDAERLKHVTPPSGSDVILSPSPFLYDTRRFAVCTLFSLLAGQIEPRSTQFLFSEKHRLGVRIETSRPDCKSLPHPASAKPDISTEITGIGYAIDADRARHIPGSSEMPRRHHIELPAHQHGRDMPYVFRSHLQIVYRDIGDG